MAAYGPDVVILLDPKSRLFDDVSVSDSDISVLSDPFSDDDDETAQSKPILVGKDVCSAFKFSKIFQDIVLRFGGHPGRSIESMMTETPDQIRARTIFTQIKKKVPLVAQMKVANLLGDDSIQFTSDSENGKVEFVPDDKKSWEDIKNEVISSRQMMKNIRKMTEKEKTRKIQQAIEDNIAYETMSGYWRLLDEYKEFRISPPGYDAYTGPEKHWLEMEPISWNIMEESRKKVWDWLTRHCYR